MPKGPTTNTEEATVMKTHTITMIWCLLAAMVVAPPLLAEQSAQAGNDRGSARPASVEDQAHSGANSGSEHGISVGELTQKVLVDNDGKKIANVSNIARGAQDDSLQAVVEVEGYYGMSRQEVLIPLSKLELKGGQFVAPASVASEKALKTGPRYETARHEVLPNDQLIERSAFAAFEPVRADDQSGTQRTTDANNAGSRDREPSKTGRTDAERNTDGLMD
jgi:hypothetical protein